MIYTIQAANPDTISIISQKIEHEYDNVTDSDFKDKLFELVHNKHSFVIKFKKNKKLLKYYINHTSPDTWEIKLSSDNNLKLSHDEFIKYIKAQYLFIDNSSTYPGFHD